MRRTFLLIAIAIILGGSTFASPERAAADALSALMAQSDEAYNTGRYVEAVPIAERIVALSRERYGEADARYAAALNGLATYLQLTGSLDRAEELLRQSVAITVAALGSEHPDVATRQHNLALVLLDKDNAVEAAELLHQALANLERQQVRSERYGSALSNFAGALERLNRAQDAERLYIAAIAEFKKTPAESGPRLAVALGNLGLLYKAQRRFDEARPLLDEAVAILEGLSKPETPHPRLSIALNNLATLREDKAEYAEAEKLYRRALDLDRAMFGPDNPRLATRLTNLAGMYINQARHDEAIDLLREALRIESAAYGDDHPRVAHPLLTAARLFSAKKDWERAYALISRAAEIMIEADARRGTMHAGVKGSRIQAGREIPEGTLSQIVYTTFLQISGEWPWVDTSQFGKLGGPAFDIAQRLVAPAAGAAIARMASRYASGDPSLAAKVRRQQELREQWNLAETRIIAQRARPADQIDRDAIEADRRSQSQLEQELKAIGADIERSSQGYAAFAGGRVLSIERVQELLTEDEALIYFADDAVHIHAFFLTRQKAAWMPLALTSATIAEHVQALRCGLDATSWLDERADRCFKLLRINYGDDDIQSGAALPFDLARAHALYEELFGTLGSLIEGKRLIVVPTGALATLPFHVLVTEKPDASIAADERYQKAAWLVAQRPVTVLPSVASLEALRSAVPKNLAKKQFVGIGNPLLDGPQDQSLSAADRQQVQAMAQLARAKARCARDAAAPLQTAMASRGTVRAAATGVRSVRELFALPDTADELCAIADALGVAQDDVLLGTRATREAVLGLNESRDLESFAVVHFATHGLVSGEVEGLAEPALALTPAPNTADSGLLTASDIAELRLNADWVVLSACNTAAAGAADDKEAFAGLARAFFLAGTRAMMVSHWPVYSAAAVELTTGAYKELRAEPGSGRAEALRRSMAALVKEGGVKARPAYWAPFVVVGD